MSNEKNKQELRVWINGVSGKMGQILKNLVLSSTNCRFISGDVKRHLTRRVKALERLILLLIFHLRKVLIN